MPRSRLSPTLVKLVSAPGGAFAHGVNAALMLEALYLVDSDDALEWRAHREVAKVAVDIAKHLRRPLTHNPDPKDPELTTLTFWPVLPAPGARTTKET